MAIGPGTLFGYLDQAFGSIPEHQDRIFDNRDANIANILRGLDQNIDFSANQIQGMNTEPAVTDNINLDTTAGTGDRIGQVINDSTYEGESEYIPNVEFDQFGLQVPNINPKTGENNAIYGTPTDNLDAEGQNYNMLSALNTNQTPIDMKELGQNKLREQAMNEYNLQRQNYIENPQNNLAYSPLVTSEGLTSNLAQSQTDPSYRYKSDAPLNPTEYRDRLAQEYADKYGIDIGLAKSRVDKSDIFGRDRFLDRAERGQKDLSKQVMNILRDQNFQQPDDYRNFMINSGLMDIAMQTGPYGSQYLQYGPQSKAILSDVDPFELWDD